MDGLFLAIRSKFQKCWYPKFLSTLFLRISSFEYFIQSLKSTFFRNSFLILSEAPHITIFTNFTKPFVIPLAKLKCAAYFWFQSNQLDSLTCPKALTKQEQKHLMGHSFFCSRQTIQILKNTSFFEGTQQTFGSSYFVRALKPSSCC